MVWTYFSDMNSGGGRKEAFRKLYIEAAEEEAKSVFYSRYGHNPERVSCTCCGQDYSIGQENASLAQVTAFERNCDYAYFNAKGKEVPEKEAFVRGKGMKEGYTDGYLERPRHQDIPIISLEDFLAESDVVVIYATDIKPAERNVKIPQQGYVWQD